MGIASIFFTAVALAMDAFAVSITLGLSTRKVTMKSTLMAGIYFGGFQALMPLIGYFAGYWFADFINAFSHWVAFVLMGFIGVRMVIESFKKDEFKVVEEASTRKMLVLAIATSIDALAMGVSFAFLKTDIVLAVLLIGVITFAFSCVGVKAGVMLGERFKARAELFGGVVLIIMGLKILIEHFTSK